MTGRRCSICSGVTAKCPICERTGLAVDSRLKLRNHKNGDGQNCGGSGGDHLSLFWPKLKAAPAKTRIELPPALPRQRQKAS